MHNYKKLQVWHKSMEFAETVYLLTTNFPTEERFGLSSQLRRASISIPSNIAEGAGRESSKAFNQFLGYAVGSGYEVETQLLLAKRIKIVNDTDIDSLLEQLSQILKMLYKLRKNLK